MSNKILAVDDDPAVRKMLTLLLEAVAEVITAASGEEGLRLIAQDRPRLLLLDMTLPGMGGFEVLKAARAAAPAMVVIVITGRNDVELAKRALESGASEYVTKPFDLARLKEKVKRVMEIVTSDERNSHGMPWRVEAAECAPKSAAVTAAPAASQPQFINRVELKAMLDDDEQFRLWNIVAREEEFAPVNIVGSSRISIDAIAAALRGNRAPLKSETIVVYGGESGCPSARKAAEQLRSRGYANVYVYEGGLKDWSENGLPLVGIAHPTESK